MFDPSLKVGGGTPIMMSMGFIRSLDNSLHELKNVCIRLILDLFCYLCSRYCLILIPPQKKKSYLS